MATTSGSSSCRRFAPALLGTVKDSFRLPPEQRRPGPAPELTPEPSPTEETPPPLETFRTQVDSHTQTSVTDRPRREKRRFAPQLIETSRRCRRNGDTSPATRPADKTDITPWAHHIYLPKPRRRLLDQDDSESAVTSTVDSTAVGDDEYLSSSDSEFFPSRDPIFSRRESMTADGLRQALEYERREYTRARQRREADALLAAFPNYNHAKYEGVEHFHARESSEDEHDRREEKGEGAGAKRRRDSEVNWWAKVHQQHAEELAKERGEDAYHSHDDDDSVLESLGHEGPPAAPMWVSGSAGDSVDAAGPSPNRGPLGEFVMPLIPETHVTPFIPSRPTPLPSAPKEPSPAIRPIGESFMPYIPSAPTGKAADMPYVPAPTTFSRAPAPAPNVGFANVGASARNRVKVVTPPMAGQDLKFRKCESPQQTKMEPDHPFFPEPGKELHRDPTGQKGLWMGYCLAKDSQEVMIPAELQGPHMIVTPQPPGSPNLVATAKNLEVCEEPARMWLPPNKSSSPKRKVEPKGLHLVAGLDDRLKIEKELAELKEKIAEEFGDGFVTQVYNYLSLGYPIMARDFDSELSKISHIPIEELRKDDAGIMSKGHIKLTMPEDERDEDRGPRWHALKTYVFEWAIQHPNISFDGVDPLHWGMRERRGSWAI
ncbi:hypothetical protein MKZ38_008212 [Zalerion maritima]|uniref:Uncharacterized protein n=1 Tax=Zalerion maritima TaxID=339359 RepID=A0AAD5RGY8_9PEZI|nr:hypothetical protein MKZ38_008212 [Zalerion maritima]